MSKQYGQNRRPEDRKEEDGAKAQTTVRYGDYVQSGQLLWSFAVALCLVLAALLQWTAPKNALLENDRTPAQIR